MKKILFKLIMPALIFSITPVLWAQSSTSDILQTLENIKSLPTFHKQLSYYVNQYDEFAAVNPGKKDIHIRQMTQAYYLAKLCQNNNDFVEECIDYYKKTHWRGKQALLAVLSTLDYPELKPRLLALAGQEEDEERKLEIEQAAFLAAEEKPPVELIRNKQQLADHWAVYMADGNTGVVAATVELLSNTTAGYYIKRDGAGQAEMKILPYMKRLKQAAWTAVKQGILNYAPIRQACFNDPFFVKLPSFANLTTEMADVAMTTKDEALLSIALEYFQGDREKEQYYQAMKYGLAKQLNDMAGQVKKMERQNNIWAIMANAGYYQILYDQQLNAMNASGTERATKKILMSIANEIAQSKSWQSCEYRQEIGRNRKMQAHYNETIIAHDPQKIIINQTRHGNWECWLIDEEDFLRWSETGSSWNSIFNESIEEAKREQAALVVLRNIIATTVPVKTIRVTGGEEPDLIRLKYQLPLELLRQLIKLPDQDQMTVNGFWLTVDRQHYLPLSFELEFSYNKKNIKITRIFYDWNQTNLNWLKKPKTGNRL